MLYISKRYPRARLLAVGFSLGANILTRYIAEEGLQCCITAACAIACPWNIVENAHALEGRWWHRNVYSKAMARNLQRLGLRHAASLAKFPDHPLTQALAKTPHEKSFLLSDFDNIVTRIGGGSSPPFPFPSALDYYRWAASHDVLQNIRVPFLAINAEDDPIVQVLPAQEGGNPYVAFAITKAGGHLGWFEKGEGMWEARRWIQKPVMEWLRAVGQDLVRHEHPSKEVHVVDGFLMEVGRNDIGCCEVEGGGHVVGAEGEGGLLAGL